MNVDTWCRILGFLDLHNVMRSCCIDKFLLELVLKFRIDSLTKVDLSQLNLSEVEASAIISRCSQSVVCLIGNIENVASKLDNGHRSIFMCSNLRYLFIGDFNPNIWQSKCIMTVQFITKLFNFCPCIEGLHFNGTWSHPLRLIFPDESNEVINDDDLFINYDCKDTRIVNRVPLPSFVINSIHQVAASQIRYLTVHSSLWLDASKGCIRQPFLPGKLVEKLVKLQEIRILRSRNCISKSLIADFRFSQSEADAWTKNGRRMSIVNKRIFLL